MKFSDEDYFLIRSILRKLYNLKVFGGKHKSIVRVYNSVPAHLRGRAKEIVKFLLKQEILLLKVTTEDQHVKLNISKLHEIEQICKAEYVDEIKETLNISN